jgi:hypothetical protein
MMFISQIDAAKAATAQRKSVRSFAEEICELFAAEICEIFCRAKNKSVRSVRSV